MASSFGPFLDKNDVYISRHVRFVEHQFPFKDKLQLPSQQPTSDDSTPGISQNSTSDYNSYPYTVGSLHSSFPLLTTNNHNERVSHSQPSVTPSLSSISDGSSSPVSTSMPSHITSSTSHNNKSPVTSVPLRPVRQRQPNPKYFNTSFVNHTTIHPLPTSIEPSSVTQALQDPQWRDAMSAEFNALLQNGTWDLVPRQSQNVISCRWIFRVKRNPDGSIHKYKARLVARGFQQRPGVDFSETFSPVTKPVTIRIVLTLALSQGWALRQLDINNAFLNGSLDEEVYMLQPPGFAHSCHPDYICRLRKAIYGLKQAPRAWYIALKQFLLTFGFKNSLADTSLFIYNQSGVIMIFLVYVDDIVLTGNCQSALTKFVCQLDKTFSLKDLGDLNHFLGVEVVHTATGLFLSQAKHISDLLSKHNMDGAKYNVTPMCTASSLILEDGSKKINPTPYRQLVGGLQYLCISRPDISYAVNRLSQFMHAPSENHWTALKRVLRYLKGTIYHGLFLKKKSNFTISAFSDSDWGGDRDTGRSTSGYVIYLGGNPISWKSSKQKSVSRSSSEAEYKAVANAAAEITWINNLLQEIQVPVSSTPIIYCDNTGAQYLSSNPVFHSRMKHISLDFHFVREMVATGKMKVCHVHTKDQWADVFTKPLSRQSFLFIRSKLGVADGSSILRGRNRPKGP